MHQDNRPTFYTKDGQPIRAAGILCYVYHKSFNKEIKDKKIWLFRNQNNIYSDTGGKTDKIDKSIIDTAIRETVEETNGHLFSSKHNYEICEKILKQEFKRQTPNPIYVDNCKYLLYPLRLRYKNRFLSLKRFGDKEIHDDMHHSYHWIDKIPKNIHPRLHTIRHNIIKL